MPLKDRISFLSSPQDVDGFLKNNPIAAIFKAGTCRTTPDTFVHVQAQLDPREDLKLGIIKVVEARPASNHVATLTGIEHESPQIILFRDGKNVFDRDNWDITADALVEGLKAVSNRV